MHLNVLGRRIANAVVWFTVKALAYNANLGFRPRWSMIRGPLSKKICYQQVYERQEVEKLHVHVWEAIGQDLAKYIDGKADELVNAVLNNDAHKVINKVCTDPRAKISSLT